MGHLRLCNTGFLSSKDVLKGKKNNVSGVPAPTREFHRMVCHDWPLWRSANSGLGLLHGTWTLCAEEPWGEMWFVFSMLREGKFLQLMKADTGCALSCSTPKASTLARSDCCKGPGFPDSTCRPASLTAVVAAPSLPQLNLSTEHLELSTQSFLSWCWTGPGVTLTSYLQCSMLPTQGGEVEWFPVEDISYSLASVHTRIKVCRSLNPCCSER